MHPELAPPPNALVRRDQRLEAILRRERQLAWLQAEQRRDVAALWSEDRDGLGEKYVADELALLWHRSPRQARNRLVEALAFTTLPALAALVADGSWLMDHADAVLGELLGSAVTDPAEQQQVLDLVVSSRPGATPYELRQATRTAIVVLFPDRAAERAARAAADRDVTTSSEAPGVASLTAYGPALDVAAMMASLDALTWPPSADDGRSAAQRRFDTLRALVCGQAQPGQWQVQVLVSLATLEGRDELPAEIVGMGPVPAPVARQAAAAGELRRIVLDEQGQLVAVDGTVHRPDAPAMAESTTGASVTDEVEPCHDEPDPDAPSAEDVAWLEEQTDRRTIHAAEDAARERARRRGGSGSPYRMVGSQDRRPGCNWGDNALLPARWSASAFERALRRLRTDPLPRQDLSSTRYAVPRRLRRQLALRDRTCIFPGCPRLAARCDRDHLDPWPHGPTSELNLASECEHHHQAKHDRFSVRRLPDGTFRWTTPTGRCYDRHPRPVLDHLSWTAVDLTYPGGGCGLRLP